MKKSALVGAKRSGCDGDGSGGGGRRCLWVEVDASWLVRAVGVETAVELKRGVGYVLSVLVGDREQPDELGRAARRVAVVAVGVDLELAGHQCLVDVWVVPAHDAD